MRVKIVMLSLVYSCIGIEHDFKGFDDSILFGINWPGNPNLNENFVDGEKNKSQVIYLPTIKVLHKTTCSKINNFV